MDIHSSQKLVATSSINIFLTWTASNQSTMLTQPLLQQYGAVDLPLALASISLLARTVRRAEDLLDFGKRSYSGTLLACPPSILKSEHT